MINILKADVIGALLGFFIGLFIGAIGAIFSAPVWAIAIVVGVATGYLVGKLMPFFKLGQNMFNITMHVGKPRQMMMPIAPTQKQVQLPLPKSPESTQKTTAKKKTTKKKMKGGVDIEIK